jgi:hypothetical protein
MYDNKFVLAISGDGECGKDLAAVYFAKFLDIGYLHSTSYAVVDYWWNEIVSGAWSKNAVKQAVANHLTIEPDFYKSKEELYEDRRNRRMDWVSYIHYFNNIDGSNIKLYKESVAQGNQILTGIRRKGQFEDCLREIIDCAVWIERPGNKPDETSEYGPELCDYTIINDGTIDDLINKIKELSMDIKAFHMTLQHKIH